MDATPPPAAAPEWNYKADFDFIMTVKQAIRDGPKDAAAVRASVADDEDIVDDIKNRVAAMEPAEVDDMTKYICRAGKNARELLRLVKDAGDANFSNFVNFCREYVENDGDFYTFGDSNMKTVAANAERYVADGNGVHVARIFQDADTHDRQLLAYRVVREVEKQEEARQAAAAKRGAKRPRAEARPPVVQSAITDEEIKRIREDKDATSVRFAVPPPPPEAFKAVLKYILEVDDTCRKIHGGTDWLIDTSGEEGKRDKLEAMLAADAVDVDEAWAELGWVVRKFDNCVKQAALIQRLMDGETITQVKSTHGRYYALCKPAFKHVGASVPVVTGVLDDKGKPIHSMMRPDQAKQALKGYNPEAVAAPKQQQRRQQKKSGADRRVIAELQAALKERDERLAALEERVTASQATPGAGTSVAPAGTSVIAPTPASPASPATGGVAPTPTSAATDKIQATPGSHQPAPASAFGMTPVLEGVEPAEGEEEEHAEEEHAGEEEHAEGEEEEHAGPATRGGRKNAKAKAGTKTDAKRKAGAGVAKANAKRARH